MSENTETVIEHDKADHPPPEDFSLAKLASYPDRFLARLIDMLIEGVVALPLVAFIWDDRERIAKSGFLFSEALMVVSYGVILYLLINGYLLRTRGQSIGKLIMKIRIVSINGSPAPFLNIVLLRFIPFQFTAIFQFISLINILNIGMIFRKDRRCLHDHLAGTRVITLK